MVSIPISDELRRAEWEIYAAELRAKCKALIEWTIDGEDDIDARCTLVDLALANPVGTVFEFDTELFDESKPGGVT